MRIHEELQLLHSTTLDAARFGAKAANLSELARIGVKTPPGLALSSALYFEAISGSPFEGLASPDLRQALLTVDIPMLDEICRSAEALGGGRRLIVRSSAVGEDSASGSFAGQLESVLGVKSADLGNAIRQVWASAWSPSALRYRKRLGVDGRFEFGVGVLIQPLLEPDFAGVMFTEAPTALQLRGTVVEWVAGLADLLVQGQVDPGRCVLTETNVGWVVQPGSDVEAPPVDALHRLAFLGRAAAQHFGHPQDIEWVMTENDVVLVQSRPITTETASSSVPDLDLLGFSVVPISNETVSLIPNDLASKDKFKLRLLATRLGIPIGQGWMISAGNETDVESISAISDHFGPASGRQFSMVLQDPARLGDEIVRMFTPEEDFIKDLEGFCHRLLLNLDSFRIIITDVLTAEKSGIAHLVGDSLAVEIGFGSYIPKGVSQTSIYVFDSEGRTLQEDSVEQPDGVFIEAGQPVTRPVGRTAELDPSVLEQVRAMTEAVATEDPMASVEFGVLENGSAYLIDLIPESTTVPLDDVRIMSPGKVKGTAVVVASEDLLQTSLEAHFHSNRKLTDGGGESAIIVAPMPYLALESYLDEYDSTQLGFVFERGSLLGHLAIILREHNIPAIVVPGATDQFLSGQLVSIDTTTSNLIGFS